MRLAVDGHAMMQMNELPQQGGVSGSSHFAARARNLLHDDINILRILSAESISFFCW